MTRTQYPPEFKLRVVREVTEVGNASEVARRYEVHPTVVGRWLKAYRRDGETAFDGRRGRKKGVRSGDVTPSPELERENEQLKRLLGEKELEIAILRDLLKKGSQRLPKD